jgi:hypothetical protein
MNDSDPKRASKEESTRQALQERTVDILQADQGCIAQHLKARRADSTIPIHALGKMVRCPEMVDIFHE